MNRERAILGLRITQGILVALALLTGLSWAEVPHETGITATERTSLVLEAPVLHPRGPWTEGDVLTLDDAGIPLAAAPEWRFSAKHEAHGLHIDHGGWTGELVIREAGTGGRIWWEDVSPLDLVADGAVVGGSLNASAAVDLARALEEQANAPGTLQVLVRLVHEVSYEVDSLPVSTDRITWLDLRPDGDFALPKVEAATADHLNRASPAPPHGSLALLFAAAGLEAAPWYLRRDLPPWERARGVTTVEVRGLRPPCGVAWTRIDELLNVARREGGIVRVEPDQGLLVLDGPTQLAAQVLAPPILPERVRFRPRGPGRS